jgi:hypothetical protein
MPMWKPNLRIVGLLPFLAAVACSTVLTAQTKNPTTNATASIFQVLSVPFSGFEVSSISASATNNVWTASGLLVSQSNVNRSTAGSLNFDGTKFVKTPLGPTTVAGAAEFVTAVAAISPNDVWTVGFNSVTNGPLENVQHFDGTKWQAVKDVAMVGTSVAGGQIFGEQLNAISAISAGDIFAAGNLFNPDLDQVLPFFEHWNGTTWSQAGPSPSVSAKQTYINGVAALSDSDVWAVGYTLNLNGVVPKSNSASTFHFDGTKWTEVPGASCNCGFTAVTAIAPDDIWAVGFILTPFGVSFQSGPMAQHWNGSNWTLTPVPNQGGTGFPIINQLEGVAAVSSKSVWAVGTFLGGQGNGNEFQSEIAHWDGTKWSLVTPPPCPGKNACGLFSVTALPTGEVWAGGTVTPFFGPGQSGGAPLILFTNKGQ